MNITCLDILKNNNQNICRLNDNNIDNNFIDIIDEEDNELNNIIKTFNNECKITNIKYIDNYIVYDNTIIQYKKMIKDNDIYINIIPFINNINNIEYRCYIMNIITKYFFTNDFYINKNYFKKILIYIPNNNNYYEYFKQNFNYFKFIYDSLTSIYYI